MRCDELQLDLPLYFDDVLSPETVAHIDQHLTQCPLCRDSLGEMRSVRSGLRALTRPAVPAARLNSIRRAVAEIGLTNFPTPTFQLIEPRKNWIDVWLMPYAVGAGASLVVGITLLWLILAPSRTAEIALNAAANAADQDSAILLAGRDSDGIDITPLQYASTRLAISEESPSINPQGALVALTRSLMRGEMSDDEVVVVADVFGDGLARIAEVVEPAQDERTVRELRDALQSDPAFAPFVPASMDQRSESVRVVLRLQRVNVPADPVGPMN